MGRSGQRLPGQVLRWSRDTSRGTSKGKNWSYSQPAVRSAPKTLGSLREAVGERVGAAGVRGETPRASG